MPEYGWMYICTNLCSLHVHAPRQDCESFYSNILFAFITLQINPLYVFVYVFSCLFPAVDTLLKDRLFRKGKEFSGGKDVDLFIVNTFGSLSQAFFVFLLLPIVTMSRGIPLNGVGDHLSMGWQCFQGITPACGSDCSAAPLVPALYVLVNLIFNVSALNLIRKAGNIALSLVMSGIVPLTMWAFTFPLPLLGAPPTLGMAQFVGGSILVSCGLFIYNAPLWFPVLKRTIVGVQEKNQADWKSSASLP